MWFMFGFITLLCFVVAYIRQKIASNWIGWPRYLDKLKYSSSKGNTPFGKDTITIAIDAPSSFDFHLKNEAWHDRLFKYIGLSSEAQIGEVDFDRSVYIVSDDAVFLNALKDSGQVRSGLLALFNHNSECIVATDELRCTSQKLWISYKIHRSLSDEDISGIIKQTVPLLHEVKDALNQASTAQPKVTTRDPFIFRASLLLVISSGLFIAGIVHSAQTAFNYVPFVLDPLTLLPMALVIAVPILITLVIVAVRTLGKSSRAHLVLIELIFIGGIGIATNCYTLLHDINIAYDRSAETVVEKSVLSKGIEQGKTTSYYMEIADWNDPFQTKRIYIAPTLYSAINIGSTIHFKQKRGYFGHPWITEMLRDENK